MSIRVLFLPSKVQVNVSEGYVLLRAAIDAGVHINAACGGEGLCGKCKVYLESGELEGGVTDKLEESDVKNGIRLACKSRIKENIVVKIIAKNETDLDKTKLIFRRSARIKKFNIEVLKIKGRFYPIIEKKYLRISSSEMLEQLSDVNRIKKHLKIYFGEENIDVDYFVMRKISDFFRENFFFITVNLMRSIEHNNKSKIINVQLGDTTNRNFAIAIDVGTTTIQSQLFNLESGSVLTELSNLNEQIRCGEDVISRIIFAEKKWGLKKLNEIVIKNVSDLIIGLIENSGVNKSDISIITFAGNSTMIQILLKINPKYIRRAPYMPVSNFYPSILAKDIGLELNDYARTFFYPVVSSYVGGDIVAGVISTGMYMSDELTLFIDLGTNAEIVLGNKDWMLCAACSAGPAFEGGGIEFGMRATFGAIEDFSMNSHNFEPMLITIGDVNPIGICGSGLIAIIAVMFEMGVINNVGKFNRDLGFSRIREKNGVYEYVLSWSVNNQIGKDIVITEIDITNFIRAKGAIYSGCISLLNEADMCFDDLDRIILAGGFGSYVDLEKAMTVGLLPEIELKKIIFAGNTSLLGARISSMSDVIRRDIYSIVDKMTVCELSEISTYMNNYIASLFLPHTDIHMFPRLAKKLKK